MDAPAVFLVGGCSWQPWRPQEQTNKEAGTVWMPGDRRGVPHKPNKDRLGFATVL